MAIAKSSGTVSGTTPTEGVILKGDFRLQLIGNAALDLESSLDDQATWGVVKSYTGNAEDRGFEPLNGVYYRLNPSSGSSEYVLAQ